MKRPGKRDRPSTWQYLRAAMGLFALFYVGSTSLLVLAAMMLTAAGLDTAGKWVADFYDRFWWHQLHWLFLAWCLIVIFWLRRRAPAERVDKSDGP